MMIIKIFINIIFLSQIFAVPTIPTTPVFVDFTSYGASFDLGNLGALSLSSLTF